MLDFFARPAATAAATKVATTKMTAAALTAISARVTASPELLSNVNGSVHGRHDVLLEFCKWVVLVANVSMSLAL